MKLMMFPFIGVMWIGTIILFIGIFISMRKRLLSQPKEEEVALTENQPETTALPSENQE